MKSIPINNNESIYIIAEAGVNHNGDMNIARQLIDMAAEAGADAVKFQTFRAEALVIRNAPKAEYQKVTTGDEESQYGMIKKLELDEDKHRELIHYCEEKNIHFLSTPFDDKSLDLLTKTFDLPRIKLPSGEITNAPLLLRAAQTGKPVILSTGMSTLEDIETALGVLAFGYLFSGGEPSRDAFNCAYKSNAGRKVLKSRVVLLHCTTAYPTPLEDVHLQAMDTMYEKFGLPVGYSDHTLGIAVPIAAAARGAVVIEKHFTLKRDMPGPDHHASLEPGELKIMIQAIRQAKLALGLPQKCPAPSEIGNVNVVRKSIVAGRPIRKGEIFSPKNIALKRPGTGIAPVHYWELLGKISSEDYSKDDLIKNDAT